MTLLPGHMPKGEALSPDFLLGFRRALYRGAGFSAQDVRRPLVGVANSWGEINPAARHLQVLTHKVKEGILDAGGTPVEFVLSALCDGTCAAAPRVNRFNLPWRDIAVAYLEAVATANMFDAMVYVGVCDEVVPAHLLAALRVDVPSILVLGGSMVPGRVVVPGGGSRNGWAGDMTGAFAERARGELSEQEYLECEDGCCTGAGACGVMGTGNTMQVFAEACGLALPGNAVAPGESRELEELAHAAGQRVLGLLAADLRPSRILTQGALENAVRAILSMGGSTCAVLHALAVADEAGLRLDLEDFDRLSRSTPLIVDVQPGGNHPVVEFHRAGGVQGTLKSLGSLLDLGTVGVTGLPLAEQLRAAEITDASIIRPLDAPLQAQGGMAILKGSLAPHGAVFKQSASAARRFRGTAKVFDTEDEAGQAIMDGRVSAGDVIVIRDNGPKGAPGMPCIYGSLWLLKSRGLDDKVALVTDGRLSGTIRGLALAHVSPESAEGGPLAAVQDGDQIDIDVEERRVDLLVDPAEVEARLARRPAEPAAAPRGALTQYRALVGPSDKGAILGATMRTEEDSCG